MSDPSHDLPAPLVPPEVNLRGYDFMPLYGEFLRRSGFNCRVTDGEFRAALNLWWSSWWQEPASSLPNDDAELCKLADLGRDIKTWRKVKAGAMSGFVLCNDGRWYHSFLSVVARETYAKRVAASIKGRLGGARTKALRDAKRGGKGSAPASAPATSTGAASGTGSGSSPSSGNRSKGLSINNLPVEETWAVDNPALSADRPFTSLLEQARKAGGNHDETLDS